VRADYRLTEIREPAEIAWSQDVEGTPFERVLVGSLTTVRVRAVDGGGARVELELRQQLRGFARFGGYLVRRATRRTLDEALDTLSAVTSGATGPAGG